MGNIGEKIQMLKKNKMLEEDKTGRLDMVFESYCDRYRRAIGMEDADKCLI